MSTEQNPSPGFRGRIGQELIVYLVLLAVIPLVLVVFAIINQANEQARQQSTNQMESVVEVKSSEISRLLDSGQVTLELILADPRQLPRIVTSLEAPDPRIAPIQQVTDYLDEKIPVQSTFVEFYIFNLDGEVRATTAVEGDEPETVDNRNFFMGGFDTPTIHPPEYLEGDVVEIVATFPVRNDDGELIGALAGVLNIEELASIMVERVGMGDTGETYLVSSENNFLVTPSRFSGYPLAQSYSSQGIENAFNQENGTGIYENYRGESVIGAYRWIPELQVAMLAEIDESEAVAALNDIRNLSLIAAAVAAAVAVVAGIFMTARITTPITKLTQVAEAVTGGDYTQVAEVNRRNEIGQLALAFNSMTRQINDLVTNLETRVNDRTRDLELAATVSRQITTILAIEELLQQVSALIAKSFNLYMVSVYLFDPETARLYRVSGAYSDGTQARLNPDLNLHLATRPSVIAHAARTRETVIVHDAETSQEFLRAPELPDTRSELSIPLILSNNLLGVFDLQDSKVNRFTEDDRRVMQSLAEQISIAVRNAQLFAETQKALREAETANQVKSQFLANMSHELRTPLNAILNFTAFVADGVMGPVNEEQVDALQQSMDSGTHLLSLINDILDITKIESGLMDLFVQEIDLNEVLNSVVSVGKGLVKDKPIDLVVDIEENLPNTFGDKRRMRQVFLNIVSNSVKFTPKGQISIRAKSAGKGIRVEVQDTGIGIASENKDLIFESFRQAKHDLPETIGTGLGMPISKYFVESHGGKMWFVSEVNVGTTFYVEMPILTEAEADQITISTQPEPVLADAQ